MAPMCNGLAVLSPKHLRFCTSTLGQFRQQAVTNIALIAAKTLFWEVSDAIQVKRCEADHEPAYSFDFLAHDLQPADFRSGSGSERV